MYKIIFTVCCVNILVWVSSAESTTNPLIDLPSTIPTTVVSTLTDSPSTIVPDFLNSSSIISELSPQLPLNVTSAFELQKFLLETIKTKLFTIDFLSKIMIEKPEKVQELLTTIPQFNKEFLQSKKKHVKEILTNVHSKNNQLLTSIINATENVLDDAKKIVSEGLLPKSFIRRKRQNILQMIKPKSAQVKLSDLDSKNLSIDNLKKIVNRESNSFLKNNNQHENLQSLNSELSKNKNISNEKFYEKKQDRLEHRRLKRGLFDLPTLPNIQQLPQLPELPQSPQLSQLLPEASLPKPPLKLPHLPESPLPDLPGLNKLKNLKSLENLKNLASLSNLKNLTLFKSPNSNFESFNSINAETVMVLLNSSMANMVANYLNKVKIINQNNDTINTTTIAKDLAFLTNANKNYNSVSVCHHYAPRSDSFDFLSKIIFKDKIDDLADHKIFNGTLDVANTDRDNYLTRLKRELLASFSDDISLCVSEQKNYNIQMNDINLFYKNSKCIPYKRIAD